ncbi:MAG TPA: hypothetical protein VNQ73_07610 [Ilumatobacter sp.]|nr:hypothetical protein [Ilumatobacter sp.]
MNTLHPEALYRLAADRQAELQRAAWNSRLRRDARHDRRARRLHGPPR